jgi:hypothetical protein
MSSTARALTPTLTLVLAVTLGACGARSAFTDAPVASTGGDAATVSDLAVRPDSPRPDLPPRAPDMVPHQPCTPGMAEIQMSLGTEMVVCRSAQDGLHVDQCAAPMLCGPGWHLCRASTYRARFGPSVGPPDTETTWIAGCVRSGGEPHAPTDEICAQCSGPVVNLSKVGWGCFKDVALGVQRLFVGVVSHPECYRIGVNEPETAAYWAPSSPDYLLRQAFCCRP